MTDDLIRVPCVPYVGSVCYNADQVDGNLCADYEILFHVRNAGEDLISVRFINEIMW